MSVTCTDVVGGPLDGLVAPARRFPWRFIGRSTRFEILGRCYGSPSPHRLLYRWADGVWLFAGDSHRVCGNCSALVRNPEGGQERAPCGLCGEVPVRT